LSGCSTFTGHKNDWPLPLKPALSPVKFNRIPGGYYINTQNATNLANNIECQKTYIQKLEFLVDEMIKYYEK
jgi:hypothetical protein